MTLQLKCIKCGFIDTVEFRLDKMWECPNCEIINQIKKENLLDFFKDSCEKFQGRMDEGKITVREILDFIEEWTERKFK